jgi:hypothetical protein
MPSIVTYQAFLSMKPSRRQLHLIELINIFSSDHVLRMRVTQRSMASKRKITTKITFKISKACYDVSIIEILDFRLTIISCMNLKAVITPTVG